MVRPHELVRYIGAIKCSKCDLPPLKRIEVLAQSYARMDLLDHLIAVRIYFRCEHCGGIGPVTKLVSPSQLGTLICQSINRAELRIAFAHSVWVRFPVVPEPSVGLGTPKKCISEEELAAARKYLRSVSFKRGTPSWENFLRRLSERK